MTKYLMTNDERMTNALMTMGRRPCPFQRGGAVGGPFVIGSFGIRHSFVIGYFVIRHYPSHSHLPRLVFRGSSAGGDGALTPWRFRVETAFVLRSTTRMRWALVSA